MIPERSKIKKIMPKQNPRNHPNPRSKHHKHFQSALIAGAIVTILLTSVVYTLTPLSPLLSYLIAINIMQFGAMAYDKRAAQRGGGRIPELVLGLWALLGASFAMIFAMISLRHKTKKMRFHFILAVVLVLQVFILTQVKESLFLSNDNLGFIEQEIPR